MKKHPSGIGLHIGTIAIILMTAIVFFSCNPRKADTQSVHKKNVPLANAEIRNFTAYYTLKGQIAMTLEAPLLLDYSQYEFKRQLFPAGMHVVIYNKKNGDRTYIEADRAAIYKPTQLVELIGHVRIHNRSGEELRTPRLFWDQVHEHIFTDDSVRFRRNNEYINGKGFDSNMQFTSARVNNISGIIYVNKKS